MSLKEEYLKMLDVEDMSVKQLRKILNGIDRLHLPYGKKTDEEKAAQEAEEDEESEALSKLHSEQKSAKLPSDSDEPDEEDSEDKSEETPKKKKKVANNG